jgi:hypothetical protein
VGWIVWGRLFRFPKEGELFVSGVVSEVFFDDYDDAPLSQRSSTEEKLLTTLVLFLLLDYFSQESGRV